jgi:excinuclease ABC subunit C
MRRMSRWRPCFLQGRQQDVIGSLSAAMDQAAEKLAFEQAAVYRDQIQSLRQVQEKAVRRERPDGDVDIVASVDEGGLLCVNLAMVRGGRHLGDRPQFPANACRFVGAEALRHFSISIISCIRFHRGFSSIWRSPMARSPIGSATGCDSRSRSARRASPCSGSGSRWPNRTPAWPSPHGAARCPGKASGLRHSADAIELEVEAGHEARIECFDISHTQGELTVAACVVYQGSGMRRAEYRRFNIEDIQPGDDYAAIRQAVQRRYEKLLTGEGVTPTLVLIDGGSGQVGAAASALAELGSRRTAAPRRRQGRSAQTGAGNVDFRGRPGAVTIGAGRSRAASDSGSSR